MKRWAACLKNQSVVISLQFPDEASHQKDLILDGYKSQGWSKLLWNPKLTILSGDEWRIVLLLWEIFFAPIIWDSFDRIIPLEKAGQGGQMIEDLSTKDEVSDLGYNLVAQGPDFKSALRVIKMVLNTQCYQYLWFTMWFHAKKVERNTQKLKIADFTM